jgi:hypothetical protein
LAGGINKPSEHQAAVANGFVAWDFKGAVQALRGVDYLQG